MNDLMKKIAQTVLCLLTVVCVSVSAQQFTVSPSVVDMNLSQPTTQLLTIKNTGKERLSLAVRPQYMSLAALRFGTPIDEKSLQESNLTPYIIVSPRLITLRPGQSRTVRVSTRIPPSAKPGSYYSHISIHPAERPVHKNVKNEEVNFGMEMAVGVAVHGNLGKGSPTLNVSCQVNKQGHVVLNVVNPSIWLFDGKMEFYQGSKLVNTMGFVAQRQTKNSMELVKTFDTTGPLKVIWTANPPSKVSGTAVCS